MTHAICVHCGAMKFGCLVTCPACGQRPGTKREIAYSFLLSDHHQPPEELARISREMIEEGAVPTASPDDEAALMAAYGLAGPPD